MEEVPSEPSNQQKKLKLSLLYSSQSNFYEERGRIETVDMDEEENTQAEFPSEENKRNSTKKMKPNLPHSSRTKDKAKIEIEYADAEDIYTFGDVEARSIKSKQPERENLTYKLKDHTEEYSIMEANDKKICPFCNTSVKNLKIHFDRAKLCGDKVDMDHFSRVHETILLKKRKYQKQKAEQKRKEQLRSKDPDKFYEDNRKAAAKFRQKSREQNPEKFNKQNREASAKSKQKSRNENPEKFDEQHRKASAKNQQKCRTQNPQKFNEDHKNAQGKYLEKKRANIDETERLRRFNMKILFGPIFICSCCKRKLYENGVTKITNDFKQAINRKKPQFYRTCISKEEYVDITLNGSGGKSGSYICQTCKTAMNAGKIPSMSIKNGLYLTPIEQDCQLTELENNLIAQNINFQYIFYLKKSRWAATKKQMISVPVAVDKVLNTIHQLPRLPREAGLIPIKLKRKKIYDRAHKSEYINPQKIFKVLHNLKKSGHPYYQFYDDFSTFENRCRSEDEDGHSLLFSNEENQEESIQKNDDDESAESETDEENIRIKEP